MEAITWRVLVIEDGRALLISESNLDCKAFNPEEGSYTWETCELRNWLNGEFSKTAFTEKEREVILTVILKNDDNPKYGTDGGEDTQDQIFLLSIAEAQEYFRDDDARQAQNTAYAKAQGAYEENGFGGWWLRSPGDRESYAATVNGTGSVRRGGRGAHKADRATRPALWVKGQQLLSIVNGQGKEQSTLSTNGIPAPFDVPIDAIASNITISDSRFIAVTGGDWHSLGLRKNGTVVAVGDNSFGQCNVSSWSGIIGITASKSLSIGLKSDGTAVVTGVDEYGQAEINDWRDLVEIATGIDHTVGLRSDGTVICVGDNKYGQCDTAAWKDIIAIAAGGWHTVGLVKDGSVVACGYNDYMQCSTGSWSDVIAIAAGEFHTVAIKRDGTAYAIGYNEDGRCNVREWTGLTAIAAGGYHTIGLKQDGTAVAVGHNSDSRCDLNAWKEIITIGAGRYHSLGITQDGQVLAMGYNNDDQCEVGSWRTGSGSVQVTATEQVSPSTLHEGQETILTDSAPSGFRYDESQITDIANYQPIISAGSNQTVGIKPDGTVIAAGLNNYGQCNVGDWADIVAVDTDYTHSVGLKQDGTVLATGYNMQGQCNVENWCDIVAIATGQSYTIGLKRDGTVLATAPSYTNGCAVEDWNAIVAVSASKEQTIGLRNDGTVVITGFLNEAEIKEIPGWTDIVAVASGSWFCLGAKSDGTVAAAGNNQSGQCEVSTWTDIIAVAAGENHSVGLRKDGTVVAAGRNDNGQCDVQDWSGIIAISAGQAHTVGLCEDGSIVATGNNGSGQCDIEDWLLLSRFQADGSSAIVSVSEYPTTAGSQEHPQVLPSFKKSDESTSALPDSDLPEVYAQSVTIPNYPLPYVVVQDVTALATQQYITARFYLEALLEIKLNAGTEAVYSALLDETIVQFALADEYAQQALLAADFAQLYMESELSADSMAYASDEIGRIVLHEYKTASAGVSDMPQTPQHTAEDDATLMKWAEDITAKFDAVKGNQRCKALGEQLGVDAREACNQLLSAQAIIRQGADADAAFYDTAMKAAMAVKTTCKVAVFTSAAIASGGASTLLEGAALVVSGSSAIIEVAATTSTIILGENRGLTLAYNKVLDVIAPVEAVMGVLTFDFSKVSKLSTKTDEAGAALLGAVDYIGNGLRDLFQDGKIMGVEIKELEKGTKMLTAVTVEVEALAFDTASDTEKAGHISEAFESAGMEGVAGVIDAAVKGMSMAAGAVTQPVQPLEEAKAFAPEVPIEEVNKAVHQIIANSNLDLGNIDLGLTSDYSGSLYIEDWGMNLDFTIGGGTILTAQGVEDHTDCQLTGTLCPGETIIISGEGTAMPEDDNYMTEVLPSTLHASIKCSPRFNSDADGDAYEKIELQPGDSGSVSASLVIPDGVDTVQVYIYLLCPWRTNWSGSSADLTMNAVFEVKQP